MYCPTVSQLILTVLQHLHGNGFDVGQKLGQPGRLATAHRRQRQGAIADDDGGGAVIAGEGAQRVPGHLRIIVAVIIDEAGRDHQAVGINGARGGIAQFADRDNFAVADRRHRRGRPACRSHR